MKALGKIGNVTCSYQQEKTSEKDGHTYWGERYTIFFEVGDDIHMVDSGWLHCQGKDGGAVILEKRGIKVGAVGEMIMRYGFRDYNGKRFPECTLVRFDALKTQSQTVATAADPLPEASAEEVAAGMAEAAAQAEEAQIDPETGLPF